MKFRFCGLWYQNMCTGFCTCCHVVRVCGGSLTRGGQTKTIERLIPHSFQPSFFSKTSYFPRVSGGFLERRIPGNNVEGTPRNHRHEDPQWFLFSLSLPPSNRIAEGGLHEHKCACVAYFLRLLSMLSPGFGRVSINLSQESSGREVRIRVPFFP